MKTPIPTPAGLDPIAYQRARRQVRALRGWYRHALIYATVITALWVWYAVSPEAQGSRVWAWPIAPTLGWGLGLSIHGLSVWSRVSSFGRQWEERKIRELMTRS